MYQNFKVIKHIMLLSIVLSTYVQNAQEDNMFGRIHRWVINNKILAASVMCATGAALCAAFTQRDAICAMFGQGSRQLESGTQEENKKECQVTYWLSDTRKYNWCLEIPKSFNTEKPIWLKYWKQNSSRSVWWSEIIKDQQSQPYCEVWTSGPITAEMPAQLDRLITRCFKFSRTEPVNTGAKCITQYHNTSCNEKGIITLAAPHTFLLND